jgi:hypothetical protein
LKAAGAEVNEVGVEGKEDSKKKGKEQVNE